MPETYEDSLRRRLMEGSTPDGTGCRLWQRRKTPDGYGKMSVNGEETYTHRISYELHHGPIPPGGKVRHHCDKPACIEPACLIAGTHADNMRDMVERSRSATGSRQHLCKLTPDKVREIRRRLARRERHTAIARSYGVTSGNIRAIDRRKSWAWLD